MDAFLSMAEEMLAFDAVLQGHDMKPGSVSLQIDGIKYTNAKLPAGLCLGVWARLGKLLGAAGLRRVTTGEGAVSWPSLMLNVATIAMDDGLVPLCKDLLKNSVVDAYRHRPVAPNETGAVMDEFDEHFKGEYLHLFKVCAFSVAHNLRGPTLGSHSTGGSRTNPTPTKSSPESPSATYPT